MEQKNRMLVYVVAPQDFFPDKAARRQVEDLIVQCEKCSWTGMLRNLKVRYSQKVLTVLLVVKCFVIL